MRLLESSLADPAGTGWKQHSVKDGVTIHTKSTPSGATYGMGLGEVPAPVGVVLHVQESNLIRGKLDRQWLSTEVLHAAPPAALQVEGWETKELAIVQQLYKSPVWPVSSREVTAARAILRRTADGAICAALRSCEVPGRGVPSGYTRGTLEAGGYQAVPAGPEACVLRYANLFDPNGSIPSSIVAVTVPERAMIVSRIRKLVADRAVWVGAPEWSRVG